MGAGTCINLIFDKQAHDMGCMDACGGMHEQLRQPGGRQRGLFLEDFRVVTHEQHQRPQVVLAVHHDHSHLRRLLQVRLRDLRAVANSSVTHHN